MMTENFYILEGKSGHVIPIGAFNDLESALEQAEKDHPEVIWIFGEESAQQWRQALSNTTGCQNQQVAQTNRLKPTYYACGICGHCHPTDWNGDCREDEFRFTNQELDDKYGYGGWIEIHMGTVCAADERGIPLSKFLTNEDFIRSRIAAISFDLSTENNEYRREEMMDEEYGLLQQLENLENNSENANA